MLKIGLTGGIGVGKTTVSNQFEKLGVPVIDTDLIAREVVSEPGVLDDIEKSFGADVLTPEGELDRNRLREKVFSSAEKRIKLENILHPLIRRSVNDRISGLNADYCVIVVPLLVETGFIDLVDKVLVIDAEDSDRISWVQKRSRLSVPEIKRIIASQSTRQQKLDVADYLIVNEGSIEEMQSKVCELHKKILAELKNG